MGTLGRTTRNGKKAVPRRVERPERSHPAVAKLAVALREYKQAVEQQAATAEILRALSRSSSDPQVVFDAILDNTHRLCGSVMSALFRYDGAKMHFLADRNSTRGGSRALRSSYPAPPRRDHLVGQAIIKRRPMHSADVPNDPRFPGNRNAVLKVNPYRAGLAVPLLKDGAVIGAIVTARLETRDFSKKEIHLLRTFADQAVIAIENVRLFNETKEALEQQTATSEILRVISNSPTEIQPVLDAVAATAARLCEATDAIIQLREGDVLRFAAHYGPIPNLPQGGTRAISRQMVTGRAVLEGRQIHVHDLQAEKKEFPQGSAVAKEFGYRTLLVTPLMREGKAIGTILIRRTEVRPFSDKHLALVRTFADQAVIAIENVRLFNETKEALEHQKASADILRIVAGSVENTDPVFEAITAAGMRLVPGARVSLVLVKEEQLHYASHSGVPEQRRAHVAKFFPFPLKERRTVSSIAILEKRMLHVPDIEAAFKSLRSVEEMARASAYRAILCVPLLREGQAIGAISVTRDQPGAFSEKQVELAKTFADQAVIAIRNAQFFRDIQDRNAELKQALDFQGASAEILSSISSSIADTKPVFDAIVRNVVRLCGTQYAAVLMVRGEQLEAAAVTGSHRLSKEYAATFPQPIDRSTLTGKVLLSGRVVQLAPIIGNPESSEQAVALARRFGYNAMILAPMIRDDKVIGVIGTARAEATAFDDKQVALLKAFADQAVIAIENARLFSETKEALDRQTATAEVLRVISGSPTDTQPVFDAILQSATSLCDAETGILFRYENGAYHAIATRIPDAKFADLFKEPRRPAPGSKTGLGRIMRELGAVHIPDTMRDEAYRERDPVRMETLRGGMRSWLGVPMLKEGKLIGAIVIYRSEPRPFTEQQIALLQTFADQAVIAVENTRLFNETEEALEQQTAISEVLRVISDSPTDVKPVLDAVAARAARICDASDARIFLVEGDKLRHHAGFGDVPFSIKQGDSVPLSRGSVIGRAIVERTPVHIEDFAALPPEEFAVSRKWQERSGWRTCLCVPLLREDRALGVISLRRLEVRPFTEKQIALVKTFADQAAIAIENVRLFNETKEALDQQTSTAEVLKTISRSTFDLGSVLQTLLDNATRLSGAHRAIMLRPDAAGNYLPAVTFNYPVDSPVVARLREHPIRPGRDSTSGRVLLERKPIHIADVLADPEYLRRELVDAGGFRTVLSVPMLRDGEAIGLITLTKGAEVDPFTEKQMEVVTTFADQAVIAIENVRLFKEIEEKSAQLEIANQHKSDFLANMSHELRTPLNAIIGFSEALMEKMFGELNEKQADYLRDIHESGKHLLSLINDILDLSKIEAGRMELEIGSFDLPSALSNAMTLIRERAQRHAIELGLEVDPRLGQFQADERKFKQIMLNLLSNAVKFTPDGGRVDVYVKKDTDKIEIAVKDTGIGIAPEDQAAVFEEFKQVGKDSTRRAEGTGLGLALTKRFVELHGGAIRLESMPGKGSTFAFTLPVRQ